MQIKNLEYNEYLLYRSKIRNLLIDSYLHGFNISYDQATDLIDKKLKALDTYIKTNAFVIGALRDENLLGFIWIYQHNYGGEECFHFNEIVVGSDYRGLGIGEKLTKKSLQMVKETGIKIIDLMVAEDNVASRRISEKQGFKTSKRYMVKRLKN